MAEICKLSTIIDSNYAICYYKRLFTEVTVRRGTFADKNDDY